MQQWTNLNKNRTVFYKNITTPDKQLMIVFSYQEFICNQAKNHYNTEDFITKKKYLCHHLNENIVLFC